MAGLYIHIPFCRNVCSYCDFHFTISLSYIDEMINALAKELEIRTDDIGKESIRSIYFGGGTPSLLKRSQLSRILETIYMNYHITSNPEITLEVNPEDVSYTYVREIVKLGINRLSIGIQSFFDEDLRFMNRMHNFAQAEQSISMARKGGINNLSIDLIYGFPGLNIEKWKKNLKKASGYGLEHLSAYHLTFEPGTIFYHRKRKRRMREQDEEESLDQYTELIKIMKRERYIHYEVSNFAREGFISVHNSGYWKQEKYIGIGPSAHSFDGQIRRWNISKNMSYIKGVNAGSGYFETERLDKKTKYHDYVMTSIRTIWGTDLIYVQNKYGKEYYRHFLKSAERYLKTGELIMNEDKVYLTEKGLFISDHIIRDLFFE